MQNPHNKILPISKYYSPSNQKNEIIVNQKGCAILLLIMLQTLFQNFEKAIYKFFKARIISWDRH